MTGHDERAGRAPGVDVDAVLLDMDGTLVDSTRVVEALWTRFAVRHGVAPSAVLAHAHGRQTRDTVRRFLPAGLDPDREVARLEAAELVALDGIVEVPGARRLLASLAGARVAVVTSAPRALAAGRLAAAGLEPPAVLVAGEDVTAGKPDPSGYLAAAAALGVAPSRCLVLEDADAGVRAALAAGAHALVVGTRGSAAARGLPRVPDLRAVVASVSRGGARVRVSWPGVPP